MVWPAIVIHPGHLSPSCPAKNHKLNMLDDFASLCSGIKRLGTLSNASRFWHPTNSNAIRIQLIILLFIFLLFVILCCKDRVSFFSFSIRASSNAHTPQKKDEIGRLI